ncbi:hypothetical protein DL96DRAFT_1616642 [Flagelloscypha sp. PMI_526]|nr:hypothetical protein DL96DRAFT_1616642 [Flagelloscypha sp. PMI_526]
MKNQRYFRFNVQQDLQGICLSDWMNPSDIATRTESYVNDPVVRARLDRTARILIERHRKRLTSPPTRRPNALVGKFIPMLPKRQLGDIHPKKKVLVVKCVIGSRPSENQFQALQSNIPAMHLALLGVFGKLADYVIDRTVLSNGPVRPAEQRLSRALLDSDTVFVASQAICLIGNISSALQFLQDQFNVSGHAQLCNTSLKDLMVIVKLDGQYALALTPSNGESDEALIINVAVLQSLCSETLARATLAAHRRITLSD